MFQNCLICTDFFDGLHRLVDFVPNLAESGFKQIIFFHSIPVWEQSRLARVDEEDIAAAKNRLSAALKSVPTGVDVRVEVSSSRPVAGICRLLETYPIDVIFMGVPLRSATEAKLFGSTSAELARSTSVPIMIFRPQLISTYTTEELALRCRHLCRHILLPYNDSEAAQYLIREFKACAVKRSHNSLKQCLLIWVIDETFREPELMKYRLREAKEKLEAIKAELEHIGLQVNIEVRQGNPVVEILDAAFNYDISAIAISTTYRKNFFARTVPSVASQLLNSTWFPAILFSPKA